MVVEPGTDDGVFYRPVVEFEATNGELYRFNSASASRPAAYDVGDAVTVRYNPDNPRDAVLDDAAISTVNLLRLLGGAFVLVGLAIYGVAALINHLVRGKAARL